jgi:AraC family transcriptional regulator of adaptative response / DNA-3-methyladenine glycosylase II
MREFYEAMRAKDPRFDGKFFIGVKTTGVYCRPICPAQPKRENVRFFADAASAEAAGYRPCLRCRPECAPLSPAWWGKKAVVLRALKLIGRNEYQHTDEAAFAARFGLSARHLRRLFKAEIGRTPKQIAHANRLNFARKLLVETTMSVAAVARNTGFSSRRRFNDAFQRRFSRAPSELRRLRRAEAGAGAIELKLAFRPPYDWQSLMRFYRSHPIPGVERAGDDAFERMFRLGASVGMFRVEPEAGKPELKLRIVTAEPTLLFEIVSRVRRMFDLDCDPLVIARSFAQSPLLSDLCARFPGLRLPGCWDPFEAAICSILGQCVSAEQRSSLIAQLVNNYGEEGVHPGTGEKVRLFPRPDQLVESDLRRVGTTLARKGTLREFSRRVLNGAISLSEAQDPAVFRKTLLETRGIGPWSAECISLRAIGDTDAFPRTDLILKRVLELHPSFDAESMKPWRSYAAIYLWRGFAETLSRKKRSKDHGTVLQGSEIARRKAQARGRRERAAGHSMGDGTGGGARIRRGEARAAPADPARGGTATR